MNEPTGLGAPPRLTLSSDRSSMSDAGPPMMMGAAPSMAGAPPLMAPGGVGPSAASSGAPAQSFVPLGEVADVRIAGGPPMVRDEAGLLVGYVYVDVDQGQRDLGGYVDDAKGAVDQRSATAR